MTHLFLVQGTVFAGRAVMAGEVVGAKSAMGAVVVKVALLKLLFSFMFV